MEKSLQAIIEEAKMELKRETNTPRAEHMDSLKCSRTASTSPSIAAMSTSLPIYENIDINGNLSLDREKPFYQNINFNHVNLNLSLCLDKKENYVYENINFKHESYEEMNFRASGETYMEMTPIKNLRLVTAV